LSKCPHAFLLSNEDGQPGGTAQRPQLSRVVLAHAPRQPGSWLTWDVDIAAWSQAGTKEFWSATAVEADEGGTAVAPAGNNVRPGKQGRRNLASVSLKPRNRERAEIRV
jgi:hypothetical protein